MSLSITEHFIFNLINGGVKRIRHILQPLVDRKQLVVQFVPCVFTGSQQPSTLR
jgi:hypothetical protein